MDKPHTDPASVAVEQRLSDFYGLAASIVDCHSVMRSAYAATEWDCLDDDGKQWVTAIVREAISRAAPSPAPEAVEAPADTDREQIADWPARWRQTGYNGAFDQAVRALRFLAENDRPSGGEQFPNSAACHMIADDLARTQRAYAQALQPDRDALVEALRTEIVNSPETADFMAGVPIEAAHQRDRWGADHDAGKTPFDWFWLVGHLAQKAADAAVRGDKDKARHHTISTAAALANWHAALSGADTRMRPGIAPPAALNRAGDAA